MTAQQALLFQWAICLFLAYMLISCLILIWQMLIAKDEQEYIKQETTKFYQHPQPYNILDEATEIAQISWKSEKMV